MFNMISLVSRDMGAALMVGLFTAICVAIYTYFQQRKINKTVNNEPSKKFTNPKNIFPPKSTTKKSNSQAGSFINPYQYFLMINGKPSAPLTFEELVDKKISEEDFVWRKGLDDWMKAGELDELENIIIYTPPPFDPNKRTNVEYEEEFEEELVEEIYKINGVCYKLRDIEIQFENGNYIIKRDEYVELINGDLKQMDEIPEFRHIRTFFPPKLN